MGMTDLRPAALLSYPRDVAVDAAGNVFISDTGNLSIREIVKATGRIITVAGTGGSSTDFNGDNIPATTANVVPRGMALDGSGNLFFADGSTTKPDAPDDPGGHSGHAVVRRIAPARTRRRGVPGRGPTAATASTSAGDPSANNPHSPATPRSPSPEPLAYTFAASTGDPRPCRRRAGIDRSRRAPPGTPTRAFSVDVKLNDGNIAPHGGLRAGWEDFGGGRTERIDLIDGATGAMLDSPRSPRSESGVYLAWNVSGHVIGPGDEPPLQLQCGAPAACSSAASDGRRHRLVSGHRHCVAGCLEGGFRLPGVRPRRATPAPDDPTFPAYVSSVTLTDAIRLRLGRKRRPTRALQRRRPGSTDRVAAAWYWYSSTVLRRPDDRRRDAPRSVSTPWTTTTPPPTRRPAPSGST